MERPTVLLALDPAALPSAEETLHKAGFETMRVPEPSDLVHRERPDLAVLDAEFDPLTSEAVHHWLAGREGEPATPAIILFGEEPPSYGSVQDEFAMKPCPHEALVYRLQALTIRAGKQTVEIATAAPETGDGELMGEGRVISVFAPKGGVGKTTVAVNMAVALREQTRDRVLLFDADVGVGNVTSVLEVPFRYGLADLADSAPEEWTDAAFEHVTSVHESSGVRVLTWGKDPGDSERIGVDLLLAALRWAKARNAYVVVDNHPGYDDRTMAMLTLSSEIFLVVTPEVGAVRNSSQFLDLAREVGLGEMVRVIVNRANHGIALNDISQSLRLPVSATIVSNGPKAVVAANEGKPIVTKYPRERIAQDLHSVARLVTHPATVELGEAPTRRWWARLGTRASNA